MNRSDIIRPAIALLAMLTAAGAAVAGGPSADGDPASFVRTLYERNAALEAGAERPDEAQVLEPWSSDLRALWTRSRADPSADVPDGPITHMYFGRPWLPRQEVRIVAVGEEARSGDHATVGVRLSVRGEPRRVTVHVVREGKSWRVSDVVYGAGGSYRATLKAWGGLP